MCASCVFSLRVLFACATHDACLMHAVHVCMCVCVCVCVCVFVDLRAAPRFMLLVWVDLVAGRELSCVFLGRHSEMLGWVSEPKCFRAGEG